MPTLDINTNGSWRTVVRELRPSDEAAALAACVALTNAGMKAAGSRKAGCSWQLRDAEGTVYGRLNHSASEDGTPTTAWRFK